MRIEKFEEIRAWQEARELTRMIYELTKREKFKQDFGLIEQMRRASVSIMANIAEGFGRKSKRAFIQFLNYASSSNLELQSHLYVALDQRYLGNENFKVLYEKSKKVGKLVNGFIKYLKQHNSNTAQQHNK